MVYNSENFHPKANMPISHIGLIPDGARRYAKRENLSFYSSYLMAMKQIIDYISLFFDLDIPFLSLYLSSDKNFKRSAHEIDAFCKAESIFCQRLLPGIIKIYKAQIIAVGKMGMLPKDFNRSIEFITSISKNNRRRKIFLLVAYNPFHELIRAFTKASKPDSFLNHLVVPYPLDIVIRTSGANLFSNFLPLQSAYARFYTIEKLFNDTCRDDFVSIINSYNNIGRLYGE